MSWFVTNLIHLKWMRSTIAVSCPGRCAQHDRLFFSFPLLPRPPLSPPFSNTRCFLPFLLACLLCLLPFSSRVFFFSVVAAPIARYQNSSGGIVCLFVYHSLRSSSVVVCHRWLCVSVVADGGSGAKKERQNEHETSTR